MVLYFRASLSPPPSEPLGGNGPLATPLCHELGWTWAVWGELRPMQGTVEKTALGVGPTPSVSQLLWAEEVFLPENIAPVPPPALDPGRQCCCRIAGPGDDEPTEGTRIRGASGAPLPFLAPVPGRKGFSVPVPSLRPLSGKGELRAGSAGLQNLVFSGPPRAAHDLDPRRLLPPTPAPLSSLRGSGRGGGGRVPPHFAGEPHRELQLGPPLRSAPLAAFGPLPKPLPSPGPSWLPQPQWLY